MEYFSAQLDPPVRHVAASSGRLHLHLRPQGGVPPRGWLRRVAGGDQERLQPGLRAVRVPGVHHTTHVSHPQPGCQR